MPALEPEIDRRQDQQRQQRHDREVVRVSGERIRPVDVRPVDRAVEVDLARPAGERLDEQRVEVVA